MNRSLKFTVLVVVTSTTKEKGLISKKEKVASTANTQPFSEYAKHTYFLLRVYVELWRVEIKNIIRVVKYEYDEYFKLWK